jgi:hypothetical protein
VLSVFAFRSQTGFPYRLNNLVFPQAREWQLPPYSHRLLKAAGALAGKDVQVREVVRKKERSLP